MTALCVAVLIPAAANAETDYYSTTQSGEQIFSHGVYLQWQEMSLHVPAGVHSEATRFRMRDRGVYSSDDVIPSLPKKYRSKKPVYAVFSSKDISDGMIVRLQLPEKKKNRMRRIFYLSPGGTKWQRLRTEIDKDNGYAQAVLPNRLGKVVLATHRYKKERPIKSSSFSSYGVLPYSDTAAVIDVKSGKFLLRRQAKKQRPIASITKVATSLVFLESNPNLDQVISYSSSSDRMGAKVVLEGGDQLTLKQVLMGALIPSANNMAYTLSISTAWSNGEFIQQMNNRMAELGLKKTAFVEPTGLDSENTSTAGNIAKLTRYAFKAYPDIYSEAAQTRQYHYTLANSDRSVTLYTTNKFNGNGKYELIAFKTGYYPGTAERTLAIQLKDIATGHEIIVVLLGNPYYNTIFQEAYAVAEWTFNNWSFQNY